MIESSVLYTVATRPDLQHGPGQQWLAKPTGEFRPPLKGEWYLSGAVVEAYQAPDDLGTEYHIAEVRLYRMQVRWVPVPSPATPEQV